jgi:hypothetical protein
MKKAGFDDYLLIFAMVRAAYSTPRCSIAKDADVVIGLLYRPRGVDRSTYVPSDERMLPPTVTDVSRRNQVWLGSTPPGD